MEQRAPWRIRLLGWGNLFIALIAPVSVLFNILAALQVFSVEWAGGSIVLATIFGAVLGFLTWRSGRSILQGHPEAFQRTCLAGGLTLGYTFVGVLVMATAGADHRLMILILHGSPDWWDWSLSHFQNSAFREIPLLAWWVIGLGSIIRCRLPGSSERVRDRFFAALGPVFALSFVGGIARFFQLAQDFLLSSQR